MDREMLKAPFPWFGGKRKVAGLVWERFGPVANYVEPFFGSGAVLLGRPDWAPGSNAIETVNDLDGFVANAWRAIAADPAAVARYADWPANENDLHARHIWLRERREQLSRWLEADPGYFDVQIAGWWLWGLSMWIGSGFCGEAGAGPWQVVEDNEGMRQLVHLGDAGRGVTRQLVHLGDAGRGVTRQLVHLGTAGRGVTRKLVHLGDAGQGVTRQRVHLGTAGQGGLEQWMAALSERMRRVRVCSGDWSRVCGPSPTFGLGRTALFFDPPYGEEADRTSNMYAHDDLSVAADVRRWCIANGDNPELRIALCGYAGEHQMPAGWQAVTWKTHGGYGSIGYGRGRANSEREVIWFSPHCLTPNAGQLSLFEH